MLQQKLFQLMCVCGLITCMSFSTLPARAEVAQGDGDPTEVSAQERIEAEKQLADEDVATVTAEGDFLLPTYLLSTVEEQDDEKQDLNDVQKNVEVQQVTPEKKVTEKTTNVSIKKEYDLPVVMIKQTELIPVSEQMAVEKKLTGSTAQTAKIYQKATQKQNIKSTKQNIQSTNTEQKPVLVEKQQKAIDSSAISTDNEIDDILSGRNTQTTASKSKKLLVPLKPTKKLQQTDKDEEVIPLPTLKSYPSVFADKIIEAAQANQDLPLIMPMDLKVTFYPNASEFSGKTIKWLKAFSYKALKDPRYVIEVRLSNTNKNLQQKRLVVIQKILAQSGLSSHQLVIDYVNRPQDSLILRMTKKEPTSSLSRSQKDKSIINW